MDLTQIRYFLAVARELNFTRAAERCNVTQPALTRAVQRLEEELGGPLLLRERALTQLTALGRAMLPLLQQTLDAADAVRAGAAGFSGKDSPQPLRIGIERCLPVGGLVPLLREVVAHVDRVSLSLAEEAPEALAEALLPELRPLPERLSRWPLWPQGVAVLLPEGHALAGLETVPVAALAGEAWLLPASAAAAAALAALEGDAGWPRAAHSAGGSGAGLEALVALGLGVALVPEGAPRHAPGCVERTLAGLPPRPVVLALPAGRPMNAAVSAFVKLARARRWEGVVGG